MIEILRHKGLVKVAEEKVCVTDLKGPLEDAWQAKVDRYADSIASMDHGETAKASLG
jgi:hypothetical protein